MLINEKKLNMMNVDDRKFLEEQMTSFLFEGKEVEIEGFVPEKTKINFVVHLTIKLTKSAFRRFCLFIS